MSGCNNVNVEPAEPLLVVVMGPMLMMRLED
jgi:hypothetical protein